MTGAPVAFRNSNYTMPLKRAIIGTWRLLAYEVWSPEGTLHAPLGDEPIGYAVFDLTGRAFIQLASHPIEPQAGAADGRQASAASFAAYFGTYTVDAEQKKLAIQVEGSNRVPYIGSTQERVFTIEGDTLTMGQPGQYRATLVRLIA